jgi:hypothetical protein
MLIYYLLQAAQAVVAVLDLELLEEAAVAVALELL